MWPTLEIFLFPISLPTVGWPLLGKIKMCLLTENWYKYMYKTTITIFFILPVPGHVIVEKWVEIGQIQQNEAAQA